MRLRLFVPIALVAAALAALPGAALGIPVTTPFNGTVPNTPGACGPVHPFTVPAGSTKIVGVATATNVANDIVLKLVGPSGSAIASGDTLTSPESVTYSVPSGASGTYGIQVCWFAAATAPPYDYSGTVTVSDDPLPLPTPGGSASGGSGPAVTPSYASGKLDFAPMTVIDPQRTEGEPLSYIEPDGTYWESGPWGTTTQNSFVHRSNDGGRTWNIVSPIQMRPDAGPGGGDTDVITDDQGNVYFVDLEALVNLGTSVSNDDGDTWRKNAVAVQNVAVDRQWYAIDNGSSAGAADNTVFLAFHQSAVGTFIYSSPGSTGAADPVGGLVWSNSSSGAPGAIAGDATCGQLRFDKVKRNLYYACNEGDHVRVTIGHVAPGQRLAIEYRNVNAPVSPGGGDVGHLFPALATDTAGNVYVAWIDEKDNQVYYAFSTDEGTTWSRAAKVNVSPANTNEFLWAQAGSPGNLVLAWLGTEKTTPEGPDGMPSWDNDPAAATSFPWHGFVATVSNAASASPRVAQQRFTEKPSHYGQICNGGIGCSTTGGDRTMADYFGLTLDRDGSIRIVFNDTTSQHHGAHLYEVRQIGGETATGGRLNQQQPSSPMADATGDAEFPHYGAPGTDLPQLDLTRLALSQPAAGTLRITMTVKDLSSLAAPAGRTSSVWLTRFQALAPGNDGKESVYRIFHAGAQSVAGGALSYFAGSTTCQETDPGNCKIVQYPAQRSATGSRDGDTITVDVPVATGFGHPVAGTLYSVQAFTFGRNNAVSDLYADVDSTGSFDATLGELPKTVPGTKGGQGGGAGGSSTGSSQKAATVQKSLKGHVVRGAGRVRAGKARVWFSLAAKPKTIRVVVWDGRTKRTLRSTRLSSVRFGKQTVTIVGKAKLSGRTVGFTLVASDRGRGALDTVRVRVAGPRGLAASGRLVRGNVVVR